MDNTQLNKKNDEGLSAIYQGISYAIAKAIKDAPYDRTYVGLVTDADYETNTYTVKIDEYEYTNIMSMIKTEINHTVVVMCPQNQLSQMFIYGEIDTTDYLEEEEDEEEPQP